DDLIDAVDAGEGDARWPVRLERKGREISGTIRIRR
ncbi:hypothetical protein MNBD_ALPHA06-1846, partial [hydrothermal vent metagenome]